MTEGAGQLLTHLMERAAPPAMIMLGPDSLYAIWYQRYWEEWGLPAAETVDGPGGRMLRVSEEALERLKQRLIVGVATPDTQ